MADKKSESTPETTPQGSAAPRKGGLKFALITVVLLAVEAGVLFALFSMGQPKGASAEMPHAAETAEVQSDGVLEVVAFDDRVSNDLSGVTYQYDVDVYLSVRKRHHTRLNEEVQAVKGHVRSVISDIFRTAEPQHFREPLHDTLRRRVDAAMRAQFDKKFPADDKSGLVEIDAVTVIIGSGIRVSR